MVFDPKLEIVSGDRHKSYLGIAYRYAADHSDDLVTRVSAILVHPALDRVLAKGANHLPRGVVPAPGQLEDKSWKYEHMIHAEPAVIFAAAREGKSTAGSTMYMPWVPCTPCAKAIIDAGIITLIGHKALIEKTPERWWESTVYALKMLDRAGVRTVMYDGEIGKTDHLFDGEIWHP